jgi:hypothetical protein
MLVLQCTNGAKPRFSSDHDIGIGIAEQRVRADAELTTARSHDNISNDPRS